MSTPSSGGRRAFAFVLVTVAIDMMSFGLIMPVTPRLLAELTGLPLEQAAPWGGYLATVYAALNFVAGPILGNLSDRFGRRPVLLVGMLALGTNFLLMGLADHIALLFVGRVLSGVAGATFSTAQAYIADTTEPHERGRAFGMIGAAFGVGFVLGPVVGGLLGELHLRAPFLGAAVLSGVNFLYGMFVLPESLAEKDRRPFDLRRANPIGAFRHFVRRPELSFLILAVGLLNFAQMTFPVIWGFFTEVRFGWDQTQIGLSLGAVGVSSAIVQGALIGRFLERAGPVRTAAIAMGSGAVALALYGVATDGWMVYGIIAIGSLSGMAPPAINAIASGRIDRRSQGELAGAIASVNAMAQVLSPIVMSQTFAWFTRAEATLRLPGAPFLVASAVTLVALLPFAIGVRRGAPAASTE